MREIPHAKDQQESIEEDRLAAVRQFLTIDFHKRRDFQDIVDLVAQLCDKPIALITLLDLDINWIKVNVGASNAAMPRRTSFCQFAVQEENILIVPDASSDPRFEENELVRSDPFLRFYAGAPLRLSTGQKIGTLCLFDLKPNSITELQSKALATLAKQVVYLMELEMSHEKLKRQLDEIEKKNFSLTQIAYIQSHNIRQPLTSIMGLLNLVKLKYQEVDDEWLDMMSEVTHMLDMQIRQIVKETMADKNIKAYRFSKMVEEIEDYAILLLDEHGHVENWNKGAEMLKGYNTSEIVGQHFQIFYTPEDQEKDLPKLHLTEAIAGGFSKKQGRRVRKDGSRFWGSVLITAIHDDHGKVIGFTKVTRDLTNAVAKHDVLNGEPDNDFVR